MNVSQSKPITLRGLQRLFDTRHHVRICKGLLYYAVREKSSSFRSSYGYVVVASLADGHVLRRVPLPPDTSDFMWHELPNGDMLVEHTPNIHPCVAVTRNGKIIRQLPTNTSLTPLFPPYTNRDQTLVAVEKHRQVMLYRLRDGSKLSETPLVFNQSAITRWLPDDRLLVIRDRSQIAYLTPAGFHTTKERIPEGWNLLHVHPTTGGLYLGDQARKRMAYWQPGGRPEIIAEYVFGMRYHNERGEAMILQSIRSYCDPSGINPVLMRHRPGEPVRRWRAPDGHTLVNGYDASVPDDTVYLVSQVSGEIRLTAYRGITWSR